MLDITLRFGGECCTHFCQWSINTDLVSSTGPRDSTLLPAASMGWRWERCSWWVDTGGMAPAHPGVEQRPLHLVYIFIFGCNIVYIFSGEISTEHIVNRQTIFKRNQIQSQ